LIRKAKPSDIPAIVELAVESVSRNPLPLKINRQSMVNMLTQGISCSADFVWVGEVDGVVKACVAAKTGNGFWFERQQSSVCMFYTKTPGLGIELLREYARWVKSRPSIKLAIFSLEPDADPRLAKLLQRLGFGLQTQSLTFCRGL
jgi:hypothetical protein